MTGGIDPRRFRDAAGQFLTGVTVITTTDASGERHGVTVNSFSSVSLDPPLVSFSLGRNSEALPGFRDGRGYVVHVLAADQQDLAVRFSAKGIDRFGGVEVAEGVGGLPVLIDALARFECSLEHTYEGGDHFIFVGRVERLSVNGTERPALGYFRGRYVTSASLAGDPPTI